MVTIECEGERTETVAKETGLQLRRRIPSHAHRSRIEGFAYAPPPGEGHQSGDFAEHPERFGLEVV